MYIYAVYMLYACTHTASWANKRRRRTDRQTEDRRTDKQTNTTIEETDGKDGQTDMTKEETDGRRDKQKRHTNIQIHTYSCAQVIKYASLLRELGLSDTRTLEGNLHVYCMCMYVCMHECMYMLYQGVGAFSHAKS
jgi:hypothetical protein